MTSIGDILDCSSVAPPPELAMNYGGSVTHFFVGIFTTLNAVKQLNCPTWQLTGSTGTLIHGDYYVYEWRCRKPNDWYLIIPI